MKLVSQNLQWTVPIIAYNCRKSNKQLNKCEHKTNEMA